jgi:myotubularin-related protein 5/13
MTDVQLPPPEGLPFLDVPLRVLFSALSIDQILLVFRGLLLEERTFLISSSKTVLTYAAEAISALLYPFKWSNIYAPVLPRHLLDFTHSPTPFLIGLPAPYANEVTEGKEAVRVDLDRGVVQPRQGSTDLPHFPPQLQENLVADLREFSIRGSEAMDGIAWRPWQTRQMSDEEFNVGVRAAFLRFFCFLLQDYR